MNDELELAEDLGALEWDIEDYHNENWVQPPLPEYSYTADQVRRFPIGAHGKIVGRKPPIECL